MLIRKTDKTKDNNTIITNCKSYDTIPLTRFDNGVSSINDKTPAPKTKPTICDLQDLVK